jgi:hypothetical protein
MRIDNLSNRKFSASYGTRESLKYSEALQFVSHVPYAISLSLSRQEFWELPASEGNYCSNNTGRRKSGMRHKITEFLD